MIFMKNILHITNGDTTVEIMKKAGISGAGIRDLAQLLKEPGKFIFTFRRHTN